jgi:hypothetical protein
MSDYEINEGSYHSDSEASCSPVRPAKRPQPKTLFDLLCADANSNASSPKVSGRQSPAFLNFADRPINQSAKPEGRDENLGGIQINKVNKEASENSF